MTKNEQRRFEVLLEQVLHEVKTVAEGHEVLRNEIKASHKELEDKIDLNASVMKCGFDTLNTKIDGVREELKEEIQGVRTELKAEIQGVRAELRETREELSAKIEAVGTKVDGHEDRIRFLERKAA